MVLTEGFGPTSKLLIHGEAGLLLDGDRVPLGICYS